LKEIIIIITIIIIQHIAAACEHLAPTECVKRHDGLAKIIHQKLAESAELIEDKSPYYKYTPAIVPENEHFTLYWNRSILTDKTIHFNRPDITFVNKKTKNTFLIDIAVSDTHNLFNFYFLHTTFYFLHTTFYCLHITFYFYILLFYFLLLHFTFLPF